MKYKNFQYIVKAPLYIRKKHYCPDCKVQVTVVKTSKIVHTDSEEAARMGLGLQHGWRRLSKRKSECDVEGIRMSAT